VSKRTSTDDARRFLEKGWDVERSVHALLVAGFLVIATFSARAQSPSLASADDKAFLGVWVIEMTEPPAFKGTHTIRIWDKTGTVGASVQTNPNFPAVEATGLHRDGSMLVLTFSHAAKPAPFVENGQPIWAVISLVLDGDTMKVAQMLERSQTIKRGTGKRQR
jgi:hypothetical protein